MGAERGMMTMGVSFEVFGCGIGGAEARMEEFGGVAVVGAALETPPEGGEFFSSVVVPVGTTGTVAGEEESPTPFIVWVHDNDLDSLALPGRVEAEDFVMPCMALDLTTADLDPASYAPPTASPSADAAYPVVSVSMAEIGPLCASVYGDPAFDPVMAAMDDPRAQGWGIKNEDGSVVSAMVTIEYEGDVGVYCMATDPEWGSRGFGTRVLCAGLASAKANGAVTASLQASPQGERLYTRIGFVPAGSAHAFVPAAATAE